VLEPNIAAMMILIPLLVELAQLSVGAVVARWKPLLLLSALVLTLSRSGVIGLICGLIVILSIRGLSKRLLRAGIAAAGLAVLAAPLLVRLAMAYGKLHVDASALARLVSWARALKIFVDHPIIGVGFNTYGFVQRQYGSDQIGAAAYSSDGGLLFVAVMTGVVGLALFCWMLAAMVRECRRSWRDDRLPAQHRGLAIGATAAIVAVCASSMFVNGLLTPFVMEPLWVVCALAFAARSKVPAPAAGGGSPLL
jgi:O-antigen ligase